MKSWIKLLPALLLLLPACDKKYNLDEGILGGKGEFAYTVRYDSIITVTEDVTDYNFAFYIKVLNGDIATNNLTCSLDGLPAGASYSPSSMTVGYLLGGVFPMNIGNLPVGTYYYRLKIYSEKYGNQFYNSVLKIQARPDNAPTLAAAYDSSFDYCNLSGLAFYPSVATTVADTPYLLRISNVHGLGSGVVVRAWVGTGTVTIPAQPAGSKTIWGSGTYSEDARPGHTGHYIVEIKDTVATVSDTDYCTIRLQQGL
jgi:hypothetical protein